MEILWTSPARASRVPLILGISLVAECRALALNN